MDSDLHQELARSVLEEHSICPTWNSYNQLLEEWIPQIVEKYGVLQTDFQEVHYAYRFVNVRLQQTSDSPRDCFLLNKSYVVNVLVDIEIDINHECVRVVPDYLLLCFPLTIHSNLCHFRHLTHTHEYDAALTGTFISKGKPRHVPLKQRFRRNLPLYVTATVNGKTIYRVNVRSEHLDKPHRSTSTLQVEVVPPNTKDIIQGRNVVVEIPFLKKKIPLYIIVLALGGNIPEFEGVLHEELSMYGDIQIFRTYLLRMRLLNFCATHEAAMTYMCDVYDKKDASDHYQASVHNTLSSEVLCHLNDLPDAGRHKVYYLAMITARLLAFAKGLVCGTDLDANRNLTADDSGTKMAQLLRSKMTRNFMEANIKTFRHKLKQLFRHTRLAAGEVFMVSPDTLARLTPKIFPREKFNKYIFRPVANGQWSDRQVAITHQLQLVNVWTIYEQTRRISSAFLNNEGKHLEPRMLHADDYGRQCAATTTENEHCGLIGGLALYARLSDNNDPDLVQWILQEHLTLCPLDQKPNTHSVGKFIDGYGRWVGWVPDVVAAFNTIRNLRRSQVLPWQTSVWIADEGHSVVVRCTRGRLMRPFLVAENLYKCTALRRGQPMIPQLLQFGLLEYLDANEENNQHPDIPVCIAHHLNQLNSNVTHVELSDASMLGLVASTLPFPRHNQGPRLVYAIGMCKQAITKAPYLDCGSPSIMIAHYGQEQAVTTRAAQDQGIHRMAKGQNCIVAFMPTGFNQEDAIVISQAAVDSGMWGLQSIRTYSRQEREGSIFEKPKPEKTFGMKIGNYKHIQEDGLPGIGQQLHERDVVIGMSLPYQSIPTNQKKINAPDELRSNVYQDRRRDNSVQLRSDEDGGIVHSKVARDGVRKARIIKDRKVMEADKFTNMHGQKGVIGRIEATENMPFNPATGVVPHLLIGPEGMTSRMTCGMILEMLVGKAAAVSGLKEIGFDDQIFETKHSHTKLACVKNVLHKYGYSTMGEEMLCDGVTGQMIECPIMVGVCYYEALTHKVSNKAHARPEGPKQELTRQPVEGRRRKGGFRLGSMELDVLGAHAVTSILRERGMDASDPFWVFMCNECNNYAEGNRELGMVFCRVCEKFDTVREVKIPYGSHLLFSELQAMGIDVKFKLKDTDVRSSKRVKLT